jgi:2-furoyl-CoA dehydrogenase FAD binding subunit
MKPAPFSYVRASSLEETLALLEANGDRARILAGGQSLIPMMNLRLAQPEIIVDIQDLDLTEISVDDGGVTVGALVTQWTLEHADVVKKHCPLLSEAIPYVAHAPIRRRGTVGGTIAHSDPAAELPTVLSALGGSVTLRSAREVRELSAADYFIDFLKNAAEPQEIVISVRFPAWMGAGAAFEEFARRPGDYALAMVAALVSRKEGRMRVGIGGVGATPLVVETTNLSSTAEALADEAVELALSRLDPQSDIHASAEFRTHLVRHLTERAVRRAVQVEEASS